MYVFICMHVCMYVMYVCVYVSFMYVCVYVSLMVAKSTMAPENSPLST